jgi:hypothetical protein
MRQKLSEKNVRRICEQTGLPVRCVLVRGGTGHRRDLQLENGDWIKMWPDGKYEAHGPDSAHEPREETRHMVTRLEIASGRQSHTLNVLRSADRICERNGIASTAIKRAIEAFSNVELAEADDEDGATYP